MDKIKQKINTVLADITDNKNTGIRIALFGFVYIVLSAVGAYNFAHMVAFGYIIWLLETNLYKG